MNTHMTDEQRIAELEDQLKEAERRIAELRQERDDARDLVQCQAEHVHDCRDQTERWIEAFDMSLKRQINESIKTGNALTKEAKGLA